MADCLIHRRDSDVNGQGPHDVYDAIAASIIRRFSAPLDGDNQQLLLRVRMRRAVGDSRLLAHVIVRSVEGIGKSTALLKAISEEALDRAIANKRGHVAFCFRSGDQRRDRAREFRKMKYGVLVVRTLREHYKMACKKLKQEPIDLDDLDEVTPRALLARIREEQRVVYDLLERRRRALWKGLPRDASTILLMTARAGQTWYVNHATRAWHHPDFNPDQDDERHRALQGEMFLTDIVLDDPEVDDFATVLTSERYRTISGLQAANQDWKKLARAERRERWRALEGDLPTWLEGFDALDEAMRLDLGALREIKIDHSRAPLGRGGDKNIYRRVTTSNLGTWWIGATGWIRRSRARVTVLTTEEMVSTAAQTALGSAVLLNLQYGDDPRSALRLRVDGRASARGRKELAKELAASGRRTAVVVNGLDGLEGTYTFQKVKGLNDLADHDVHVIETYLSPAEYARVCAVGLWAGIEDPVGTYYADRISQAIGRNTGYRQREGTTTTLIMSHRLARELMPSLVRRFRIEPVKEEKRPRGRPTAPRSIRQERPWIAAGIGRTTWFKRRRNRDTAAPEGEP
jgi:hypothetical protein